MKNGINFNRPALEASRQAARRRTIQVSLGVAYLALLAFVTAYLAMHGFLVQRALLVARTGVGNVRGLEGPSAEAMQVDPAFLDFMDQVSGADQRWAPKLTRLAKLLPANAWIVKLDAGTANVPLGEAKRRRLTFNISATTRSEEDKILFPIRLVETLQRDSTFAAGYGDIHFSSTKVLSGSQAVVVNFDVECR